jgi:hypothetical protein
MTDRALRWLWLAIVIAASVYLRLSLSTYTPRFDAEDETGYYRTESAYQYRYARMIALGFGLPDVDKPGQWPEGVKPRRELTSTMEWCTGWAYRLLPTKFDFRWFVVLWVAVTSSLSIPALYFLGALLTGAPWIALAAAAAYGLSWAAMSNVVATYTFESFTLPWIHWSLALFAFALLKRSRLWAAGSGLALAVALSSWHFTRFYMLSFLLALAYAAWKTRADAAAQSSLRKALGPLLLVCGLAGLVVGSMRENVFILSPAMLLGAGLWLALSFPAKAKPILGATLLLAAARALGSSDSGSYGHVYSLFLAKIRFGLTKPANPALLTQEERALWMGPFNSPGLGFTVFCMTPLVFIAAPRALALKNREAAEQNPALSALVDALLVLYAAGSALVLRVMQMFVFFLCLGALRLPKERLKKASLALFFAALALLETVKALAPASRWNPFMHLSAAVTTSELHPTTSFDAELGVIRWLRRRAGPGVPVLSNVAFSSTFLTYAGSPILIHPKFEAPGIRQKTADFLDALFSDEETFARYCDKYGAKLFVFTVYEGLDQTGDGPLYLSGREKLPANSAAVLFQFHPEKLKRFTLAYQNEGFRVYARDAKAYPAVQGPPPAIYDEREFHAAVQSDGSLALDVRNVLERVEDQKVKLFLARLLRGLGRREEALAAYEEAFKVWPADEASRNDYDALRRQVEGSGKR